ncbi:hypothetical protein N9878_02280 [bacterium]|nr:hypothetical protein [bacterium]
MNTQQAAKLYAEQHLVTAMNFAAVDIKNRRSIGAHQEIRAAISQVLAAGLTAKQLRAVAKMIEATRSDRL